MYLNVCVEVTVLCFFYFLETWILKKFGVIEQCKSYYWHTHSRNKVPEKQFYKLHQKSLDTVGTLQTMSHFFLKLKSFKCEGKAQKTVPEPRNTEWNINKNQTTESNIDHWLRWKFAHNLACVFIDSAMALPSLTLCCQCNIKEFRKVSTEESKFHMHVLNLTNSRMHTHTHTHTETIFFFKEI